MADVPPSDVAANTVDIVDMSVTVVIASTNHLVNVPIEILLPVI
jgi:hypothetical protein